MSRTFWAMTLLCVALTVAAPFAHAAPIFEAVTVDGFQSERLFAGTRSAALGRAIIAAPAGPEGALLNAAVLDNSQRIEASFAHLDWYGQDFRNYAAAGTWRSWRWSLVRNELREDDLQALSVDPNPPTYDALQRMDLVNLGWSFRHDAAPRATLRGGVGVNFRRYTLDLDGEKTAVNTVDLGFATAVRHEGEAICSEVRLGASWQNLFDSNASWGTRNAVAPRRTRVGLETHLEFPLTGFQGPVVTATLAGALDFDRERGFHNSNHLGAELVFLSRLAVRAGKNENLPLQQNRWGLGFLLEESWTGPLRIRFDWARIDTDPALLAREGLNAYGISVALRDL